MDIPNTTTSSGWSSTNTTISYDNGNVILKANMSMKSKLPYYCDKCYNILPDNDAYLCNKCLKELAIKRKIIITREEIILNEL